MGTPPSHHPQAHGRPGSILDPSAGLSSWPGSAQHHQMAAAAMAAAAAEHLRNDPAASRFHNPFFPPTSSAPVNSSGPLGSNPYSHRGLLPPNPLGVPAIPGKLPEEKTAEKRSIISHSSSVKTSTTLSASIASGGSLAASGPGWPPSDHQIQNTASSK